MAESRRGALGDHYLNTLTRGAVAKLEQRSSFLGKDSALILESLCQGEPNLVIEARLEHSCS